VAAATQKRYCIIKFQPSFLDTSLYTRRACCLLARMSLAPRSPLSLQAKDRKVIVTLDLDVRRLAPRTIADARSRDLRIEMLYGEDAGLRLVGIGAVLARWVSEFADAIGADAPFKACSAR
jgi:hypothetical protein